MYSASHVMCHIMSQHVSVQQQHIAAASSHEAVAQTHASHADQTQQPLTGAPNMDLTGRHSCPALMMQAECIAPFCETVILGSQCNVPPHHSADRGRTYDCSDRNVAKQTHVNETAQSKIL